MNILNIFSINDDNKKNKIVNPLINDVKKFFKLPIEYCDKKIPLSPSIIKDLELIETIEKNENPLMSYIFEPSTEIGKSVLEITTNYYTDDISFLRDTQKLLKNYDDKLYIVKNYNDVLDTWYELKNSDDFLQKYMYIDYDYFKFLNNNENFLQIKSLVNITSPIITLLTPFFLLIIPFILIKIQNIPITFSMYKILLYKVLSEHSFFKIFTNFNTTNIEQLIYSLISGFFYLFSVYQNIMLCFKFNFNIHKIHNIIFEVKNYLKETLENMNNFIEILQFTNSSSYKEFQIDILTKKNKIQDLVNDLDKITPYKFSLNKLFQIGYLLKIFHNLYSNDTFNDIMMYTFGFNGFIELINGLTKNIKNKSINYTKFLCKKKNKKQNILLFKNLYYPTLINDGFVIKNNIKLDKNLILTGVNASGKTTILKSILFNVILSQSFGCGTFDKCSFYPYKYLHCYLNILDTSDRLSLFQSECKKCKDIMNIVIENSKNENHLCIFDELFSGTNPEEAINCGYGFLLYFTNFKNSRFLLTTHFNDLCSKLNNIDSINIRKMFSYYDTNNILKHTYKIKDGINEIKGGVEVLKQMDYPKEIIDAI